MSASRMIEFSGPGAIELFSLGEIPLELLEIEELGGILPRTLELGNPGTQGL